MIRKIIVILSGMATFLVGLLGGLYWSGKKKGANEEKRALNSREHKGGR